jgi:hypothetical protein
VQTPTAEVVLERLVGAVEKVRERLLRATAALEVAGDLTDVGLVNELWLELLPPEPPELIERLRIILANPDG